MLGAKKTLLSFDGFLNPTQYKLGGIYTMVFTPQTALKPENLPSNVVSRFAEVELALLLDTLTQLNQALNGFAGSHELAVVQLLDLLTPNEHPDRDDLGKALVKPTFAPSKQEMVHCLLYAGASIRVASKISGVSTQTAQRYRTVYPDYYPVFEGWNRSLVQKLVMLREFYNIYRIEAPFFPLAQFDIEPYKMAAFYHSQAQQKQEKEASKMTASTKIVENDYDNVNTDTIIWD